MINNDHYMKPQICLVPNLQGLGGPVSFQAKFVAGLNQREISYTYDINHPNNTAILINGGTRHLWRLWRAKRRTARVVQRLNGMNWTHKVEKTPFRFALRSEINNRILAIIRRYLTDYIIYQSEFSQTWWNKVFRETTQSSQVTYNGVDLEKFSPIGPESPPHDHFRVLLVEGHLSGPLGRGVETAVKLVSSLKKARLTKAVELMVVGDVDDRVKARAYTLAPDLWITWRGVVDHQDIPTIDRSAHVLFSADLNAACPNSVVEALACGLPVIAYDTGALKELVRDGAGEVVPYGTDYWQLEEPHIPPLAAVCCKVLQENQTYRQRARTRAETSFGLDAMVESYLQALL
jgi:glycosyltransferase involved in cell wall biosynthesis